jgi:predicted RNA-binding Zn-ribbon protein involved in translation (DUF1610 family)
MPDRREWVYGNGPKIVTIDIETFPNLVYTWGLFKQTVGINQVVRDWSIASICWKWLDKKKPEYLDCEADPLDDSALLAKVWEVLDGADIVVGQNSKHFDIRKINARLIESGYPPPSPYRQVDTKIEARKVAMFTSNRLEWLSQHLADVPKDKHKEFPGFELWRECLAGNPKAWAAMRKYNPTDVLATEQVYLRLRPWIEGHPNLANYNADQSNPACPKCGSDDVQKRGVSRTQSGVFPRFHCNACGGWSRGRYTVNTISERRNLLAN